MKTFFLSMAGALAAMFIFIFLMFSFLMLLIVGASSSKPERPDAVVLSLDLNSEISDQAPTGGFAALSGTPGFIDLLTKLKAAETDDHVKGLFIRGAFIGTGSARAGPGSCRSTSGMVARSTPNERASWCFPTSSESVVARSALLVATR